MQPVPILALRNSVLFPMSVAPVNVGRARSVRLVEHLVDQGEALVGVVTQRHADTIEPTFEDLYEIGTLARIVKVIRLGETNYSVVLNGIARFRIVGAQKLEPFMQADCERLSETGKSVPRLVELGERLRRSTREMLAMLPDLPRETSTILDNVREPGALADLIASNFPEEHASIAARQEVLVATDLPKRVELVMGMVERQLGILKAKRSLLVDDLGKGQRDIVLRQQLRTIRDELGESGEDDELDGLRERLDRAGMPEDAAKMASKQLRRLASMPPQSSEYQVARSYIEWLVDLPWSHTTPDRVDVAEVRRCLEEDHFGLEQVKKRIVEFSAIRQLRRDKKGPILLFIGPPGVGKTSLGRSIARAMGRKYARVALGGVRDEAEIRGHRRTYVGALPGRIIQALKKVGSRNPVLVLDEIDKMGADMRGDPASALLEVLDPEQNETFVDHYIDTPFDLSKVLFLATANSYAGIPEPLQDRLEIIEVPGYTRDDKLGIAGQFLVPKQLREHGLTVEQLSFQPEGLAAIVDLYTREAGVRGLEREIAAVCRGVTVRVADGETIEGLQVTPELLEQILGPQKVLPELTERMSSPGIALGLGVSGVGGDLLFVEATLMPGGGKVHLTGKLGPVLKEAATAAISFVRSRAESLGLSPEWLHKRDLHVHVPRARATSDAAGAGLAVFAAVASGVLQRSLRTDVALVGEITLRGRVLRVEHLKDMLLAAHRAGVARVVIPSQNRRDLDEIPAQILSQLEIVSIDRVDEVLSWVLASPKPPEDESESDELDQ